MPDNDLATLVKEMQRAADENDAAAIDAIEKAYRKLYGRISRELELALRRLLREGEKLTPDKIREALAELQDITEEELTKFSGFLENSMPTWATASLILAGTQAITLLGNLTKQEVQGIDFGNLSPSALDQMLAFVAEGSPLYDRINLLSPYYGQNIIDKLVEAVQQGWNPRFTAAQIEKFIQGTLYTADGIFANPLADALRMTRTAQLWAQREAAIAQYAANGIEKWVWFATIDDGRCCASCVIMHGTIHDMDEMLDDHYNGRCAAIPLIDENPIQQSGMDWLESQSEEKQREVMGNAAYNAWKDGAITLDQLSTKHADDVYGMMRGEASLVSILGADAQKYYGK